MRGCWDEPLFQGWPLGTSALTGKQRRLVCKEHGHCGHVQVRREGTGRRRREGRGARWLPAGPGGRPPPPSVCSSHTPGGIVPLTPDAPAEEELGRCLFQASLFSSSPKAATWRTGLPSAPLSGGHVQSQSSCPFASWCPEHAIEQRWRENDVNFQTHRLPTKNTHADNQRELRFRISE